MEWVAGAAGAILLSAIVFVLVGASVGPSDPPDISARVTSIERAGSTFVVEVIVRNDGDETAAQLVLEATSHAVDGSTDERQVTLDYLPPHSKRRVGFIFSQDPRAGQLMIEAHGYVDP